MHVRNLNCSIVVDIPRQCNIIFILVLSVHVLNAIGDQFLGIVQSIWKKFLKNRGQFPQDSHKEIGVRVEAKFV